MFFPLNFVILWTLPVLLQRWFSTCLVYVHTLRPRENRVQNILDNSEKNTIFNEHPVYHDISDHIIQISESFLDLRIGQYFPKTLYFCLFSLKWKFEMSFYFYFIHLGIYAMIIFCFCINFSIYMHSIWIVIYFLYIKFMHKVITGYIYLYDYIYIYIYLR